MDIMSLIRRARTGGASDIHLAVSSPPVFRVHGVLQRQSGFAALTAEDIEDAFTQITTERERLAFYANLELDFGYSIAELVRLRCNAAMHKGTISLAMRLIPHVIPDFETLHLPQLCKDLALRPRGLVIVSGPTGSGKSTTLAAMIDYLNHNESRRVVTIEDPIEYVYTNDKCVVIQRELGGDTLSFTNALKHVLRQDPDVILVGEMRDMETASAALTIAETGHLLITTGHAPSTYQAVERIVDLFPPHERHLAQTRLASLLLGILCQTLVPTLNGPGRAPAVEVMLANPAVRSLIREGKIHQLPNTIRTYTSEGMKLLDHSLVELYLQGMISGKTLLAACNDRHEVETLCSNINQNIESSQPSFCALPGTFSLAKPADREPAMERAENGNGAMLSALNGMGGTKTNGHSEKTPVA